MWCRKAVTLIIKKYRKSSTCGTSKIADSRNEINRENGWYTYMLQQFTLTTTELFWRLAGWRIACPCNAKGGACRLKIKKKNPECLYPSGQQEEALYFSFFFVIIPESLPLVPVLSCAVWADYRTGVHERGHVTRAGKRAESRAINFWYDK